MKLEKSCGAVVFKELNNKRYYLILRHLRKGTKGGHWDLPKGHVEQGESEEQTALREVKEETNLDVQIIQGYRESISYFPALNVQKEVIFFLAKADNQEVMLEDDEIEDHRWLEFEGAFNMLTFQTAKNLVKKAEYHLNNNT